MNQKTIFLTAIILISFLTIAISAQAAEFPGAAPDSPFYFLKTWKESIQTFFTFGLENKAKQYLRLAETRLAEYQKMIDKGNAKAAEKTLTKYEKQLNRALQKAEQAKQKGKETKDLTKKLEETISKHTEILEKNLEKVPEQAKQGLEKAIESSQKQTEKIKKLNTDVSEINSFDECAKAGYPVLTTAPRQCKASDGRTFIEEEASGAGENTGKEQGSGSTEKGGKAGEAGTQKEKPANQEGIISTDVED